MIAVNGVPVKLCGIRFPYCFTHAERAAKILSVFEKGESLSGSEIARRLVMKREKFYPKRELDKMVENGILKRSYGFDENTGRCVKPYTISEEMK
jgi:hypothetical protein